MPVEVTEQQEAQGLEKMVASPESADVSENTEAKVEDTATAETAEETETKAEETKKVEEKPDPKFDAKVQAEADKRTRVYQERREADTAVIRSLNEKLREALKQNREKVSTNQLNKLLDGYKKEEHTEEEINTFQTDLKNVNAKIQEYNEKFDSVNEAAEMVATLTEKLAKSHLAHVIKNVGLDDPNPVVRARNGFELLTETVKSANYHQNLLMVLDTVLPKGDEIREQIEAIANEMSSDPELTTDKAKKLYLAEKARGLVKAPKKAPPSNQGSSGGVDISKLDGRQLMELGYKNEK